MLTVKGWIMKLGNGEVKHEQVLIFIMLVMACKYSGECAL